LPLRFGDSLESERDQQERSGNAGGSSISQKNFYYLQPSGFYPPFGKSMTTAVENENGNISQRLSYEMKRSPDDY
jgi:hypothetical protein